jgi:hypothetical protein
MAGGNVTKTPFALTMNNFTQQKVEDNQQRAGQALPCTVVSVQWPMVTVAFEIEQNSGYTIPQVTMPVAMSVYIKLPIQTGDSGLAVPADARLGGISGLGTGLAPLALPSNLGALVFLPISNTNWTTINPSAVVITAPNSQPIYLDALNVNCTNNLNVANGATGTFTTSSGQTVQVQNGIVTNII